MNEEILNSTKSDGQAVTNFLKFILPSLLGVDRSSGGNIRAVFPALHGYGDDWGYLRYHYAETAAFT